MASNRLLRNFKVPKYAQFDTTVSSPSPVIGWFDTDIFHYPNLPESTSLIEVTDIQWAVHFNEPSGWFVKDGVLIPPEAN